MVRAPGLANRVCGGGKCGWPSGFLQLPGLQLVVPAILGVLAGTIFTAAVLFLTADHSILQLTEDAGEPGIIKSGNMDGQQAIFMEDQGADGWDSWAAAGGGGWAWGSSGGVSGGGGEDEEVDYPPWARLGSLEDDMKAAAAEEEYFPDMGEDSPILKGLQQRNAEMEANFYKIRDRWKKNDALLDVLVKLATEGPEAVLESVKENQRAASSNGGGDDSGDNADEDEEVRQQVAECMKLYRDAEDAEDAHRVAYQLMQQADRELVFRQYRLDKCKEMTAQIDWWQSLNLSADDAVKKIRNNTVGPEIRPQLENFLMSYIPFGELWEKDEKPEHPLAKGLVKEQEEVFNNAARVFDDKAQALLRLQHRLWTDCGLRLPRSNWTEELDAKVKWHETLLNLSKPGGEHPQCVDPTIFDPDFETKPGLATPAYLWQKDPELYPDPKPHFSFLLRYYGAEERVKPLVDRLYQCTGGMEGNGTLAGIRAEMYVNVFEPNRTLNKWIQMWHETDPGIFVIPVLPHIVNDPRAYNDIAKMAKGKWLVFMQDDDLPPADCEWLRQLNETFSVWPRLGMVGYHTDRLTLDAPTAGPTVNSWYDHGLRVGGGDNGASADGGGGGGGLMDPETGVRMHFTGLVNFAPVVIDRRVLHRLGWLDEADDREGEAAIISDWQLCSRVWLSGYQVAKLRLPRAASEADAGDFSKNTRTGYKKITYEPSYLADEQAQVDYGKYDAYYVQYHDKIVNEVDRLNSMLVPFKGG